MSGGGYGPITPLKLQDLNRVNRQHYGNDGNDGYYATSSNYPSQLKGPNNTCLACGRSLNAHSKEAESECLASLSSNEPKSGARMSGRGKVSSEAEKRFAEQMKERRK